MEVLNQESEPDSGPNDAPRREGCPTVPDTQNSCPSNFRVKDRGGGTIRAFGDLGDVHRAGRRD